MGAVFPARVRIDYMEYAVGVGFFRFHLNFFFHPLFGFFLGLGNG